MSIIMKVFLLLAVMVCISEAQLDNESGSKCLCGRVRNGLGQKKSIKDIQIYSATIFCDKVEIVVTLDSGLRYCLNPNLKAVKKVMASIMKPKISTTATPAEFTSTPGSSNTARF